VAKPLINNVMSEAIGRISRGHQDPVTVVLLTLEPSGPAADPIGYKGSFILSEGAPLPRAGESFILETAGGRSGQILVERVSAGPHQDALVFFRTSGPFA
jgi:hypothetical protein